MLPIVDSEIRIITSPGLPVTHTRTLGQHARSTQNSTHKDTHTRRCIRTYGEAFLRAREAWGGKKLFEVVVEGARSGREEGILLVVEERWRDRKRGVNVALVRMVQWGLGNLRLYNE